MPHPQSEIAHVPPLVLLEYADESYILLYADMCVNCWKERMPDRVIVDIQYTSIKSIMSIGFPKWSSLKIEHTQPIHKYDLTVDSQLL